MRKTTIHVFRKLSRLEEMMIRAAMPRTSAADPEPLPVFAAPDPVVLATSATGLRLVKPLTATLSEVARA